MAVALATSVESHTGTSGSTSEGSFDLSVPFTSATRGLAVLTFVNANADDALSVKIDPAGANTDVPSVTGGRAVDTAGEAGDCKLWFLGAGLPSTTKTVRINRTNNGTVMYAVAILLTADMDTQVYQPGIVLVQENATLSEQSVGDGPSGTNSLRFAGINSGLASIVTNPGSPGSNNLSNGANSTWLQSIDFGQRVVGVVGETTAGQGSRSIGFDASTSDDVAAVHFAIREVVAPTYGTTTDNFNRTSLGSGWTTYSGAGLKTYLDTEVTANATGGGNGAYYNADALGTPADVVATLSTLGSSGSFLGIELLSDTSYEAQDGYGLFHNVNSSTGVSLFRADANSYTPLGSDYSHTASAGDKLWLRVETGGTVRAWLWDGEYWIQTHSVSDSTYTGPFVRGIVSHYDASSSGLALDDLAGGGSSSTIVEGTGSAAGSAAASGVGATIIQAEGSSSGAGAASGNSAAIVQTEGSAAGAAASAAEAAVIEQAEGTAGGSATVSGDGEDAASTGSDGTAAGSSEALGVGAVIAQAEGAVTAGATGTGESATIIGADGSASGAATGSAEAAVTAQADGSAAGSATTAAEAASIVQAEGTAAGSATVSGEGADAAATGSDGTAAGSSQAQGVGAVMAQAEGAVTAGATGTGESATIVGTEGQGAGSSEAAAVAAAIAEAEAIAAGAAQASGAGATVLAVEGSSEGQATALGVPVEEHQVVRSIELTLALSDRLEVSLRLPDRIERACRVSDSIEVTVST